jgi:hypothetical protein
VIGSANLELRARRASLEDITAKLISLTRQRCSRLVGAETEPFPARDAQTVDGLLRYLAERSSDVEARIADWSAAVSTKTGEVEDLWIEANQMETELLPLTQIKANLERRIRESIGSTGTIAPLSLAGKVCLSAAGSRRPLGTSTKTRIDGLRAKKPPAEEEQAKDNAALEADDPTEGDRLQSPTMCSPCTDSTD